MIKKYWVLFFITICNATFGQNKYEQYAQQIDVEKSNLKKIEMLCNLGFYYTDSSKAITSLAKAQLLSKQENNLELSTLIDVKLALVYEKFKNNKKKSELTNYAINQLPNLKNTNYTADIYYQLGRIEEDKTKGLSYYFKGLEIADKVNNYELPTQICFNISGIYGQLLKIDFMKKYVDKAIAFAKKANTYEAQIAADLSLGSYFLDVSHKTNNPVFLDSVIHVYNKSELYIAKNEPSILFNNNTSFLYLNLANAYFEKGIKNNEKEFLYALNKAEEYGNTLQAKQTINYAIGLRGEYYLTQKQFSKAIENFKHGLDLELQNKDYRVAIAFCESLLKCYELTNDFENYRKYASLKSEYSAKQFDISTTNQIVLAEEKFENEKKSFIIKTLEKENTLQKKNKKLPSCNCN